MDDRTDKRIEKIGDALENLGKQVVVLLEKVASLTDEKEMVQEHEKRLDGHDYRLRAIEGKQKKFDEKRWDITRGVLLAGIATLAGWLYDVHRQVDTIKTREAWYDKQIEAVKSMENAILKELKELVAK